MTNEEIKDFLIEQGYDYTIIYENPSYSDAFIGVSLDGIAIYDYDLMIKFLVENDNMTVEEAIDWIDYNTIGAKGKDYPIVISSISK